MIGVQVFFVSLNLKHCPKTGYCTKYYFPGNGIDRGYYNNDLRVGDWIETSRGSTYTVTYKNGIEIKRKLML